MQALKMFFNINQMPDKSREVRYELLIFNRGIIS